MAYNSYFPAGYQPYQYPQQQQQYSQQQQQYPQQSGLVWVQGEAGAKSYLVAPNTSVLLMDSEAQKFYIKTTDASGMPLPLRVFSYAEASNNAQNAPQMAEAINPSSYVTKREFDAFKAQIDAILKQEEPKDE